ncbi:MAG: alcohol dehydrogenase catalytic domain-containing protein [Kofleriaceae bacterium]
MKAAQLIAPGSLVVRDIDVPVPSAGEVLLQVCAAGMCGSDAHIVHAKQALFPLPLTLGHETTARVETLGAGVTAWERGQTVSVAGIWGCGRCRACLDGRENACEYWARRTPVPLGPGLGFPGGMAEWMVAPARALYALGDLDPVEAAPLADAGVTPCHAINLVRSHLRADATVAVIGVGGLGHMALQILRATTACRIIAIDTDEGRLGSAKAHGADDVVRSDAHAAETIVQMTAGLGVQAVFDFAGVSPTLALANAIVANYGALVIVGLGAGSATVIADAPPAGSPRWGVTLIRPYGATNRDIFEVIGLAQRGKLKADIERHRLADAPQVLEALVQGRVRGRAVLVP